MTRVSYPKRSLISQIEPLFEYKQCGIRKYLLLIEYQVFSQDTRTNFESKKGIKVIVIFKLQNCFLSLILRRCQWLEYVASNYVITDER
jgi:hypothetical protein